MKRTALAALAAVLVALPAPAAAATTSNCNPRGSKTVEASKHSRAFTMRLRVNGRSYLRHYACLYSANRRHKLLSSGFAGEDRYSPVRLSGRFAAYGFVPSCGACENSYAYVELLDLRTGRHVRAAGQQAIDAADDGEVSSVVHDLELRPTGVFGWIAEQRVFEPGTPSVVSSTYEVHTYDGLGRRLLDSGTGIEPRSLALAGETLYWRSDGVPRSATLR